MPIDRKYGTAGTSELRALRNYLDFNVTAVAMSNETIPRGNHLIMESLEGRLFEPCKFRGYSRIDACTDERARIENRAGNNQRLVNTPRRLQLLDLINDAFCRTDVTLRDR